MKIRWTSNAFKTLQRETQYIKDYSSDIHKKSINEIESTLQNLKINPYMGRVGLISNTREIVIQKYPFIVVYAVISKEIAILAVYHMKRDRKKVYKKI